MTKKTLKEIRMEYLPEGYSLKFLSAFKMYNGKTISKRYNIIHNKSQQVAGTLRHYEAENQHHLDLEPGFHPRGKVVAGYVVNKQDAGNDDPQTVVNKFMKKLTKERTDRTTE
jgi:hypothetical protein